MYKFNLKYIQVNFGTNINLIATVCSSPPLCAFQVMIPGSRQRYRWRQNVTSHKPDVICASCSWCYQVHNLGGKILMLHHNLARQISSGYSWQNKIRKISRIKILMAWHLSSFRWQEVPCVKFYAHIYWLIVEFYILFTSMSTLYVHVYWRCFSSLIFGYTS